MKFALRRSKSSKSVVVIEVGNEWIKIAEYDAAVKGGCITKVCLLKLAEIKGAVPAALDKAFAELKLNRQSVITYVPRHLATVRTMEIPSTDPREINDIVSLQVSKQTPYSRDEIVSSHCTIDTEKSGYAKVMLAIIKRSLISERFTTLEKSSIDPERVLLSSEAVYHWFKAAYLPRIPAYAQKTVVVIDIDSNYSDCIVIREGKFTFSRNVFVGANNLAGEETEWRVKFADEIKRSIDRYKNEQKDSAIGKIFLSGAAQNIEGLDAYLGTELDMAVETIDLFAHARLRKEVRGICEEYASVSPTALFGVATYHKELKFDLKPTELRVQNLMEEKRKQLTVLGILLASLVMMVSSLLLLHVYNKNAYLVQLRERIQQIERNADEIDKMRSRVHLVENRLDARGASLNLLHEIHTVTPEEIFFTDISIEAKKSATVKGRARGMSDVFKFVTTLENSPHFKNVKTTYTTTRKEKNIEYANFEIVCTYEQ